MHQATEQKFGGGRKGKSSKVVSRCILVLAKLMEGGEGPEEARLAADLRMCLATSAAIARGKKQINVRAKDAKDAMDLEGTAKISGEDVEKTEKKGGLGVGLDRRDGHGKGQGSKGGDSRSNGAVKRSMGGAQGVSQDEGTGRARKKQRT